MSSAPALTVTYIAANIDLAVRENAFASNAAQFPPLSYLASAIVASQRAVMLW